MKNRIKVYDFECTCSACPTQFEFTSANGKKWYFRYRHGYWKLYDVTNDDNWEPIIDGEYGNDEDGVMSEETFLELLKEAGYDFEIVSRKQGKTKFKNLRNLINLCKDDLVEEGMSVNATLDKEDLIELKELLEYSDVLESQLFFSKAVHGYDVEMIDKVKGETVELYKTIDLMAEDLFDGNYETCYYDETAQCMHGAIRDHKECIKQYYYNKVKQMRSERTK